MIGVTVCLKSGQNIRMYFEEAKGYEFCKRLEKVYDTNDRLRIHEEGGAAVYFIPGKAINAWYCHDAQAEEPGPKIQVPGLAT